MNDDTLIEQRVRMGTRAMEVDAIGPQGGVNRLPAGWMPDWKRRQLIPESRPRVLQPSLHQRIARLNPQERHDLQQLVRSQILRKAIRAILAASFHKTNDTASSK